MTRIGFIGLGTMGAPMARNVMAAGYDLCFYARRSDVVREFAGAGATSCSSPAEVAGLTDIVITIVTADQQVEDVVLGKDGIVEGAAAGKLLIDMSTISPQTVLGVAKQLQAAGMSMLDAPVSGGPSGAERGTLTIMVGGDGQLVERARSVLEAMGQRIFHIGPLGTGQITKLVNQMIAGGIMTLIGEGMAMVRSAGLDLNKVAEVVSVSSGNSTVFDSRIKFILEDSYPSGFKAELMRKDISLAIELARQLNTHTPVAAAALDQYDEALQSGFAEEDFSAVAKVSRAAR